MVYLEVEVRAVEVGQGHVVAEEGIHVRIVDLDDLVVLIAQIGEPVSELVEGEGCVHALHLGQYVLEGPGLGAGGHGPRIDEREEQA